jgi:dynein light intermediate chain
MSTPSNLTQPVSLVKYGNAVMVSTSGKKNIKDTKNIPQNTSAAYTEDILNSILPPREYTMDKQQLW